MLVSCSLFNRRAKFYLEVNWSTTGVFKGPIGKIICPEIVKVNFRCASSTITAGDDGNLKGKPMSGRPNSSRGVELPDPSIRPSSGWHCTHSFYSVDRNILRQLSSAERRHGAAQLHAILSPAAASGEGESADAQLGGADPLRMQSFIVSGHKADFATLAFDPDPLKIDRLHQRLLASAMHLS